MDEVEVRKTGLVVSRVALGTWAMGGNLWGGTDEKEAIRTVHAALDRGVTLIDTAPIYGFGVAETIVGKALATSVHRSRAMIATKFGLEWKGGRVCRNSSKEHIFREIDASRRRLGREWIDIYQVHWPDPRTPIQQTAEALAELLERGTIRAIGVSNYSPRQMEEFEGFAPLHTSQPPYNLFERGIEEDVLPHCRRRGITTLMYGALCRGLLSGRMKPNTAFGEGDIRNVDPKFQPDRFPQYLSAIADLERLASDFGKSILQLAVRWVLDQPGSQVALWGARKPGQIDPLDGVCGWALSPEQFDLIDGIVAKHIIDPVGPEFMAPPLSEENP